MQLIQIKNQKKIEVVRIGEDKNMNTDKNKITVVSLNVLSS